MGEWNRNFLTRYGLRLIKQGKIDRKFREIGTRETHKLLINNL